MEELMETVSVGAHIAEAMKAKSMSVEKLAQLTGISERFLEALIRESGEKLPATPYVRGYLAKIASILNLNGEELWKEYATQYVKPVSPVRVEMNSVPHGEGHVWERFLNTKILIAGGAVLGILLVVWIRGSAFIGKPTLSLSQFDDASPLATSTFVIKGKIDPKNQLTINDEVVFADDGGVFEKKYTLTQGFNTFHFKVKGILGKELDITKQVYLSTSTKQVEHKATSTTTQ